MQRVSSKASALILTAGVLSLFAAILAFSVWQANNTDKPDPVAPIATQACKVDDSTLLGYINDERSAKGLTSLTVDSILSSTTKEKLDDMVTNAYYGHNEPDGSSFSDRLSVAGIHAAVAEDIDNNANDPLESWTALKNSPSHYATLTDAQYTRIGIASKCVAYTVRTATGPDDNSGFVGGKNTELTVIQLAGPEQQVCPVTTCNDGTCSDAVGRGTCSHHTGIDY